MNARLKIGSLCSGYGGLDLAIEEFFDAETAWVSEFDAAPSRILGHHWPSAPNLGDMTKIDWATVEPVDIIAGGTPCQDLSGAGKRRGMTEGTRSNLWVQMREAIAIIKPSIVVWENVRGAYSARADSDVESEPGLLGTFGADRPALRALGRVLGDLSELGFDAEIVPVRASDAGAPHARFRVFVIAVAQDAGRVLGRARRHAGAREAARGRASAVSGRSGGARAAKAVALLPTPIVSDTNGAAADDRREHTQLRSEARLFPTPRATDGEKGGPNQHGSKGDLTLPSSVQMFPTPQVADAEGGHATRSGSLSDEPLLPRLVTLFPTPTASDGERHSLTYPGGNSTLEGAVGQLMATPTTRDWKDGAANENVDINTLLGRQVWLFPTPRAQDFEATMGSPGAERHVEAGNGSLVEVIGAAKLPRLEHGVIADYEALWASIDDQAPFWVTEKGVDYWPAISRWARVLGRPAPSPTIPDGKDGRHRLNPAFDEWMMGCDRGWLTNSAIWADSGYSYSKIRNAVLKAAGNGVVTRQAVLALEVAWPRLADVWEIAA